MALLDRLTNKQKAAPKKAAAKPAASKTADKKASDKSQDAAVNVAGAVPKAHAFTLLRPHVSEKAAHAADRGIYVFDVPVVANKAEIAKAVESQYKVEVAKVRTIRGIGKQVRRASGRTGRRNRWKKALVELKKGQTLNLVEGV